MTTEIRNCEDALRVLAEHLDGELETARQRELERHLKKCRSCYSRAEFERRLKEKVAETGRQPVSSALNERVRKLIREFAVSGAD